MVEFEAALELAVMYGLVQVLKEISPQYLSGLECKAN